MNTKEMSLIPQQIEFACLNFLESLFAVDKGARSIKMKVCTRSLINAKDEERSLQLMARSGVSFAFNLKALSQIHRNVELDRETTKQDMFNDCRKLYGSMKNLSNSLMTLSKFLNADPRAFNIVNPERHDFASGNLLDCDPLDNSSEVEEESEYSLPLQQMLMDDELGADFDTCKMGEYEEHSLRNQFLFSTSCNNEVSFFCYLLVDPSMISKPCTCSLLEFVSAVFYIGKGKHCRPLQHLVDAHSCRGYASRRSVQLSAKLKRILELWDRGFGVISLHVSHNIHASEAFIREGSMIATVGIKNLTNVRKGNFRGLPIAWAKRQVEEFGAMQLRKAHVIFRNERCRPVFEADLSV